MWPEVRYNIQMPDFMDPSQIIARLELREGMHVADFGCGSGHFTFAAARRVGHSGKVFAIDVQKELLEQLATKASNERVGAIKVIWGDFDEPRGSTLEDSSLDAVVVSNVLFQAEHREQLASEVVRVLKPLGRVLVVDWSDSFGNMGPVREQVVTEEEARSLFLSAGLEAEDSFPVGSHHYGLILKKPQL